MTDHANTPAPVPEPRVCPHGHEAVIIHGNGDGTVQRICTHPGCDYSVTDDASSPIYADEPVPISSGDAATAADGRTT